MMPERIWAGYMDTSERDCSPVWSDINGPDETEYIRADVVDRMIAAEREAIENIVLAYGREQIELYRDARTNPDTIGHRSYYDGTSDAADVLWGRIHDRERDDRREDDPTAGR